MWNRAMYSFCKAWTSANCYCDVGAAEQVEFPSSVVVTARYFAKVRAWRKSLTFKNVDYASVI